MNKNTIPFDPSSPFYPSGIRLGTTAITTRAMKEKEMEKIGAIIAEAIEVSCAHDFPDDKEAREKAIAQAKKEIAGSKRIKELRKDVLKLCKKFPLHKK